VKYVCLIYMPTDFDPAPEQRKALGAEYERLNATLDGREDVVRARLSEAHTATTVRLRDGQRLPSEWLSGTNAGSRRSMRFRVNRSCKSITSSTRRVRIFCVDSAAISRRPLPTVAR
jgi:hypothetical protein